MWMFIHPRSLRARKGKQKAFFQPSGCESALSKTAMPAAAWLEKSPVGP
jgi:hypothetical protein